MYQVFKTKKGILVEEVPVPIINEKEILVKVFNSLISTGTETAGLKNSPKDFKEKLLTNIAKYEKLKSKINDSGYKAAFEKVKSKAIESSDEIKLNPFGYSIAGEVIAVGDLVKTFIIGDRVACAGSGFATHSEFARIPINLAVRIPDGVDYEAACFTTVGSIAMQGIRRAEVKSGETIVIVGLGLIGLLAVQIAKAWGLRVIGIDLMDERVDHAIKLGCDIAFNASNPEIERNILSYTDGYGADSVIIYAATKSSDPTNQAMRYCRQKGRVVVVGAVGMELDRDLMYKKELDFVISTSYGPGRYDDQYELEGFDYPIGYVRWTENRNMREFVRLVENESVIVDTLISSKFDILDAAQAFEALVKNPVDNIAILIKYGEKQATAKDSRVNLKVSNIIKQKINVGLIGAGGFAQRTHLPNLQDHNSFFQIRAIADRKPENAKYVGKKFHAEYVTSDYNELLADKNIDLIVITTQHNNHARLSYDALINGKNVLVEKPLAINWDQFKLVTDLLKTNPIPNLFIGFNRRYSPFIQKSKKLLSDLKSPKFVNYRINAGAIRSDHWIQDPGIGGGRLIGEVCHFIDLANYLTDSQLSGFNILNVPVDGNSIQCNDNFAINLSYSDGSVAQISYISIGGKSLEKEKIEIHCAGKSMVISDFTKMEFYNFEESNVTLKNGDKGHRAELAEIAKKLKGENSLIPDLSLDLLATELALRMVDVLNGKHS